MTREQAVRAMRLAGLSEAQIEAALAQLALADKVAKFARALAKLGERVTFEVQGQHYRAEVNGLTFEGEIKPIDPRPRGQGQGRGQKDSARKVLEDLAARGGYEVTEAALKYAAAYIQRTKALQDALRAYPDLWERVKALGILK